MVVWSLHKQRGTDKDIRGLRPTINPSPLSRRRNNMSHFIPWPADSCSIIALQRLTGRNYFRLYFIQYLSYRKMRGCIFCDAMSCSPLKVDWIFGAINRLHLQGKKLSHVRNRCFLPESWLFIAWLSHQILRWKRRVYSKRRLTFNGLCGTISQMYS